MNREEQLIAYYSLFHVSINTTYVATAKIIFKTSKASTSKNYKPVQQLYRIYDRAFISNYPSKSGQNFFKLHNKVTIAFNFFIVLSFVTYIVISMLFL
jgi:hypothetical protein